MSAVRSVTIGAFLALLMASFANSAQLQPETLAAWNGYLAHERYEIEKRASVNHDFLWVDAGPARLSQIRAGSVLVEPFDEITPLHIEGGLIHHWIGAVFFPSSKGDDVIAITRDYQRYKDYYKPAVEDAFSVSSHDDLDEFTILFSNNSILSRTSLEGEYVCKYSRLDSGRWYSVSRTRQMQEIKNYGQPSEKRLTPGHGSGYIWSLFSTSRLEERDGGVIYEIEAIALSRDVPGSLRWLVDPVIRRESKSSLEKSLSETAAAVRARTGNLALNSR